MRAPIGMRLETRPAFELLFGLYALTASEPRPSDDSWVPALRDCSPRLRELVAAVGPESGELWLHLLGFALELPTSSAAEFVERLADVDAVEMRRHLVGVHVPAWRAAVGAEALEATAAGDMRAAKTILADTCYYGGQGRNALSRILPLTAAKTKRQVLAVVRQFAKEVFAGREAALMQQLRREVRTRKPQVDRDDPVATVRRVTGGYVYEQEPWQEQLLLIPQLAAPPWLLLCQHRATRIICYPAIGAVDAEGELRERAVRLGRALSDVKRVEILRRLARGEASLNELVEETGLVKSTVHHHLALLRAADLITVSGQARGMTFALSGNGIAMSGDMVRSLRES